MPSPFEYLPDVTKGPGGWAELDGLMANPSTERTPQAGSTILKS